MKILFVNHNSDLYGASRCLLRLAARLAADGHAVRVVLPTDGPLGGALRAAGVPVTLLPRLAIVDRPALRGLRGLLRLGANVCVSSFQLWRLIRRERPDIVHSNTSVLLSAAPAARLAGAAHVYHLREFYTEFPAFWRLYRHYLTALSRRVFCVSQAVAGQFSPAARARRAAVLYDGFPRDEFRDVAPERVARFRRAHGLAGGPAVGVVGRVKLVRKGQETLLRAVALLREELPSLRAAVIGSPFPGNEAHATALRDLAHELGIEDRVVFTGDVEDVQAAYAALDVVVLPSGHPEPFGGVVIEAMALGRPVVGTAIGGTVEQIEDGVTGLLVPPADPPALAAALRRLLADADLRRSMGERGRRRFLERFEFEPYYRRLLELYAEAARR
jgi:glycosyltransferase involved in cell wall biosynthesis